MRRFATAVLTLALAGPLAVVAAGTAAADTTQTASCTDAGGHLWQGRDVWARTYVDSAGVRKIGNNVLGVTSAAPDATTLDITVTSLDGSGAVVGSFTRDDVAVDLDGGATWYTVDPRNPPSDPGRSSVRVTVGDGDDGKDGCTMTFVQPGAAPNPTPTATPTSTPAATPTPTTTPTSGSRPTTPPARVCGNTALLTGPSTPPVGATTVAAGDNSDVDLGVAGRTYWFAPGTHTLGTGRYDQIIPGDGSTYLGGPGAVLDGQGKNAYAFTQRAKDVTISYLTIRNFVAPLNEGTVNHDSGQGWTVSHSTVTRNGGAGVFLGSDNTVSYSCLSDNSQYGFQGYSEEGPAGLVLDHNEVGGNNTGDWETKEPGCGCTGGGKFWEAHAVKVTNNYVHDNASVGLWADTNDYNFLFQGNWISDNDGQAIFYEISYNAAIRDNVIVGNLKAQGPQRIADGDDFPDAAIYLSESGGDARVPYDLVGSPTIDISGNLVKDNYNGVTLWENADRYCGSPANTSTGVCTLVDTSLANAATCVAGKIVGATLLADCRWKTKDVHVHDNTFAMDASASAGCSENLCGRNAVFSNYGTYPDWSPYKGDVVQRAIAFDQGNVFSDNTYVGNWHFNALESDEALSPAQWQAAPYGQDKRSTFGG